MAEPTIDEVVRECERAWKRLGVPRPAAAEMASELRADLEEAQGDGMAPASYVAGDARGFARRWAVERDVIRPRLRLVGTALSAILGAVPGAGLGLFFAYGLSSDTFDEALGEAVDLGDGRMMYSWSPEPALILGLYALAGLCVAGGAILAVRAYLAWRMDPACATTTRWLLFGIVPAVGFGALHGMGYAAYHGFNSDIDVMVGDALAATAGFALAIMVLRALAVFSARGRHAGPAAATLMPEDAPGAASMGA